MKDHGKLINMSQRILVKYLTHYLVFHKLPSLIQFIKIYGS